MASASSVSGSRVLPGAVAGAGWLALFGLAVAVGALVYLHVAPTGLSPLREAVSRYGISAYRGGYRVMTLGLALAGAALAVGVGVAVPGPGRVAVVAALVVFAVARAVISWYPMDEPTGPHSPTGRTHGLIAVVTFGAAAVAALRLGRLLGSGSAARWSALAPVSTTLGAVMLAVAVTVVAGRGTGWLRDRFGALERVLYLAIVAWIGVFAAACALRLA